MNRDGVALESVKWGFKKWNSPGVIINARAESIRTKSMFSKHLETGRCVVPAGEFFEWEN
jgi:putative SOS response-associated peptidase YedK